MADCYWLCLQNTFTTRQKACSGWLNPIFISETEIPENPLPVVVECKEVTKDVVNIAERYQHVCIFSETFRIDTLNFSLLKSLAAHKIAFFWNIEDVTFFVQIANEIIKSDSINDLINVVLHTEHAQHMINVSELSYEMSLRLTDSETAFIIRSAAMLHDIGKLYMPQSFLNTPGYFTALEKEFVKLHTIYGASILKDTNSTYGYLAKDLALNHHERLDGSGYPRRKKSFELSLASKIVMVADVYDAIRNNRPYRSGCDHDLAISFLKGKKEQFDSKIIKILEEVINESKNLWNETQGRCNYSMLRRS